MEYNRKGENQGWWTLKPHVQIPEKEEMLKMTGPETAVLNEAMAVGVRALTDAGYSGTADDKGKDDEESKLPLETQLAPWNTTKNFIAASQNKAWLRLHGEGDPSGRGEAFSFLRASMKEAFLRPGETREQRRGERTARRTERFFFYFTYLFIISTAELEGKSKWAHKINIAEQNQIYRSEIERIWKAQYASLSSTREPVVTQDDEIRYKAATDSHDGIAGASPGPLSRDATPDRDETGSIGSRGGPGTGHKILKIRRRVSFFPEVLGEEEVRYLIFIFIDARRDLEV
jgi:hypothetical protein